MYRRAARKKSRLLSIPMDLVEKLLDYDVYDDIRAYEKDVLIIHGDADTIVPLSYSEKAVREYASAQLKVIEGAGHGFYGREGDLAAGYILDYLEGH